MIEGYYGRIFSDHRLELFRLVSVARKLVNATYKIEVVLPTIS